MAQTSADLLKEFINFNQTHGVFSKEDNLLVAVSAGIDSLVLTDLLLKTEHKNIALVHCNFTLRGKASDLDQAFVEQLADTHRLAFFSKQFDTVSYAKEKGISIQMAARDLRFRYFSTLCKEKGYNKIAVGTHKNDLIETFFINLIRGSALQGLTGIKTVNQNIIRPLLFALKTQIKAYAEKHKITYREDASNKDDHYLRNALRLNILPKIKELSTSFDHKIVQTTTHLQAYKQYTDHIVERLKTDHLKEEKQSIHIEKKLLDAIYDNYAIFYDVLSPYGFNTSQTQNIIQAKAHVGASFSTHTHNLYVDRTHFIIVEKSKTTVFETPLSDHIQSFSFKDLNFKSEKVQATSFELNKYRDASKFTAIDFDSLVFPLKVRAFKTADRFMPLGMSGFKKVSDYYTDEKIPSPQKKDIPILENGNGDIVALLTRRLDERYKVTAHTKWVYIIHLTGA